VGQDARNRIIEALEKSNVSRQALADKLGLGRGAVSAKLNAEGEFDSVKYLEAAAELTGYTFDWLRTGKGPEKIGDGEFTLEMKESSFEYLTGKVTRLITVTVDRTGKELISYVPVKAAAGYTRGFSSPQFIEKLPAFNLPNLPQGSYRMFQVDGESMRQLGGGGLHDGDVVIGQYVEDIFSLKDNRVYVVVRNEGLLAKRVINRLTSEEKVLVLKSDNKNGQYPDIVIHPKEILEVWELKAFISRQLSFSTDLWDVINDMQVEQALIRAKVNEMARGNHPDVPLTEDEERKRAESDAAFAKSVNEGLKKPAFKRK